MTSTTLRRTGFVAALLFSALLLPAGASAGGASGNVGYGGFGCVYSCGYDGGSNGGGRHDRCYHAHRCHDHGDRRHPWPPFAPVSHTPEDDALRDYWANSDAFKKARERYEEEGVAYHKLAEWYQSCIADRRHCGPPPEWPH